MNKNNLTKGLFTTLLLVSSVVAADEKYPAADFQPSVVYQSDAVKNGSSTQAAVKQAAPVVAQATHEVDSKYPAADFQPTVVYSDDKYQHNKTVPVSASKQVSGSSTTEKSSAAPLASKSEAPKEDSSLTYLLGLIGLAGAGIFLFKKQTPAASSATKKANIAPASSKIAATTGVGKYINKVSGTGVSRYVEKQVKVEKSATSVARYVAQKTLADKARAAEDAEKNATGVEKYMRNRG